VAYFAEATLMLDRACSVMCHYEPKQVRRTTPSLPEPPRHMAGTCSGPEVSSFRGVRARLRGPPFSTRGAVGRDHPGPLRPAGHHPHAFRTGPVRALAHVFSLGCVPVATLTSSSTRCITNRTRDQGAQQKEF